MNWLEEYEIEIGFKYIHLARRLRLSLGEYDLDYGVDTGDKPINRFITKRVSAAYDQTVLGTIDKYLSNPLRLFKFPNTVDENADDDQKHLLHFKTPFLDSSFYVNVYNPKSAKRDPPIGSARLHLGNFVLGGPSVKKTLELKDPSGNKIGEVEVDVAVRRVQNPPSRENIVHLDVEEEPAVEESDGDDVR